MLVHYKCDNCGADMGFDSDSGTLHCSSCGAKNNIEEMAGDSKSKGKSTYEVEEEDKRFAKESFEQDYEDSSDTDQTTDHSTFQGDEARQYQCNNCGANLITDDQTTATRCSFCGAGIVLETSYPVATLLLKLYHSLLARNKLKMHFVNGAKKVF